MKPVDQTVTGWRGNCFSACLASILEIPCDDVPNINDMSLCGQWFTPLSRWLREKHGYDLLYVQLTDEQVLYVSPKPFIATCETTKGYLHSVVMAYESTGRVVVHDPDSGSRGQDYLRRALGLYFLVK